MKYNHILVRFGELSTKGKNKKDFIKKLRDNTKAVLYSFEKLTYQIMHDRMFIMLNGEDEKLVCEALKNVFGIHSFSVAIEVEKDMNKIKEAALYMVNESKLENEHTFKVLARRSDKSFYLNSDEINRDVATILLKNTDLKVDVHHPDMRIQVEIRPEGAYVLTRVIMGAGGYPVGMGAKALVMLSGGIDSPVASYLAMKRGVEIECIHFASPPYTSERAQQKVLDLAAKLSGYQGRIKVHVIPFTEIQLEIYKHSNESYPITIMRRMMYRIAERVANQCGCRAIVNGESLGQVASQTIESMDVINSVVNCVVLRPLITYDKNEIIELSRKINTYDISIQPFEDCCTIFTPKNPITKPTIKKAESFERWDFESFIENCVNNEEIITVSYKAKQNDLF